MPTACMVGSVVGTGAVHVGGGGCVLGGDVPACRSELELDDDRRVVAELSPDVVACTVGDGAVHASVAHAMIAPSLRLIGILLRSDCGCRPQVASSYALQHVKLP